MNVFFRKLLIVLAILFIIIFLANLFIDNPYSHRLARTFINEKIKEVSGLNIEFEAIKLSIFPLGVDLYGFDISPNEHPQDKLIAASHIKARVSLLSFVFGSPSLSLIELTNLEFSWPLSDSAIALFKSFEDPQKQPSGLLWPPDFRLPVENIVLKNANIVFAVPDHLQKQKDLFRMALKGLDLELNYDNWQDIEAIVNIKSFSAITDSNIIENAAIKAELELDNGNIIGKNIIINSSDINFEGELLGNLITEPQDPDKPPQMFFLSRRISYLTALEFKTTGQVLGNLTALGRYLKIGDTKGNVKGDVSFKCHIPLDEPKGKFDFLVEGKAAVEDGLLYGFSLLDSKAEFAIDAEKIEFKDVELISNDQKFGKVKGKLLFDDKLSYAWQLNPEQLSFTELLKALTVDFNVFSFDISSQNIDISGTGDPFVLKVKGLGLINNFSIANVNYDKSKFPHSPQCLLQMSLTATKNKLVINDNDGLCFTMPTQNHSYKSITQSFSPPQPAQFISKLFVKGDVFFDEKNGIDLKINSPDLQLGIGQYFSQTSLKGNADLNVNVIGPYTLVKTKISGKLTAAEVHGIFFGSGSINLMQLEDRLEWKSIELSPFQNAIISLSDGYLHFGDDLKYKTNINVRQVPDSFMDQVSKIYSDDLKLKFAVQKMEGDLHGPLLVPFAYQGRLFVDLANGYLENEKLFDSLSGIIESRNSGWSARQLSYEIGTLRTVADIQHQRIKPFEFQDIRTQNNIWQKLGFDLKDQIKISFKTFHKRIAKKLSRAVVEDHMQTLPFAGIHLQPLGIKGLIFSQGSLHGNFEGIKGDINTTIKQLHFLDTKLASVKIKTSVNGSKLDNTINYSGNTLTGRIWLDMLADGLPYEWFFNANNLDLRALLTTVFSQEPRNYAYITSEFYMKGKLGDWWASTGTLDIKDIRIKYVHDAQDHPQSLEIIQTHPTIIDMQPQGWTFRDNRDLLLKGQYFMFRVAAPNNRPPTNLNVVLEGEFDLAVLSQLFEAIESSSGKVKMQGTITGSTDNPDIDIRLFDATPQMYAQGEWQPLSIGLLNFRPAFNNIHLNAHIRTDKIDIQQLTADKGKGKIAISGLVVTDPNSEQNSTLNINLSEAGAVFSVEVIKSFETVFSGNLTLTGKTLPYRLSGDVKIDRARSTSDFDIRNEIIDAIRKRSYTTSAEPTAPIVEMDLNIMAEDSIKISNRNLQTSLSANLQVRGDNNHQVVSGQVEVIKGKVEYKRDFKISQGTITFDDPIKLDPRLDLLLVSEVNIYRVYINITGKASNPKVDLSVDPPLREDGSPITKADILMLISSGQLPRANRAIGETSNVAKTEALNIVAGQFEAPIEKLIELSGQTVIRRVYVDAYSSEIDGRPILRLNVPLNIGENLDVVVKVDEQKQSVSSEYPLHESISLSGSIDRQQNDQRSTQASAPVSDTGVDLKFQFAFP